MPAPVVIVPTFNGAQRLPALLESLRRQTLAHDVVVVDNASPDGTRELLRERFPEAAVIPLPRNVGFGRAVNAGVAASEGDPIVLVNDDAECEPGFVEALVAALDIARGFTAAAGVLLQPNGSIDTAGVVVDATLFAVDYLHGRPASVLEWPPPDPFGPSGGAAAWDRGTFLRIGGFDETFFAYLEDVDLAARHVLAGGRCALAAGARAVHRHSSTLGSGSRRKDELMGWSRGYTLGKYRIHERPALLARAALLEAVVVAGQVAFDRTAVGAPARFAGFRVGRRVRATALPRVAAPVGVGAALRYRLRRGTARVRGRDPAGGRRPDDG